MCGGLLPPSQQFVEEPLSTYLEHHADYGEAFDVKGMRKLESGPGQDRFVPDYHAVHRQRNHDGLWRSTQASLQRIRREVMDETGVREFFADAAAVSYERS
uniref:Uncharacterized protein n=1 Tax=Zooxanthella nutricula TaxID=1333877 RepID=A0A7S2PSY3_9DINO